MNETYIPPDYAELSPPQETRISRLSFHEMVGRGEKHLINTDSVVKQFSSNLGIVLGGEVEGDFNKLQLPGILPQLQNSLTEGQNILEQKAKESSKDSEGRPTTHVEIPIPPHAFLNRTLSALSKIPGLRKRISPAEGEKGPGIVIQQSGEESALSHKLIAKSGEARDARKEMKRKEKIWKERAKRRGLSQDEITRIENLSTLRDMADAATSLGAGTISPEIVALATGLGISNPGVMNMTQLAEEINKIEGKIFGYQAYREYQKGSSGAGSRPAEESLDVLKKKEEAANAEILAAEQQLQEKIRKANATRKDINDTRDKEKALKAANDQIDAVKEFLQLHYVPSAERIDQLKRKMKSAENALNPPSPGKVRGAVDKVGDAIKKRLDTSSVVSAIREFPGIQEAGQFAKGVRAGISNREYEKRENRVTKARAMLEYELNPVNRLTHFLSLPNPTFLSDKELDRHEYLEGTALTLMDDIVAKIQAGATDYGLPPELMPLVDVVKILIGKNPLDDSSIPPPPPTP